MNNNEEIQNILGGLQDSIDELKSEVGSANSNIQGEVDSLYRLIDYELSDVISKLQKRVMLLEVEVEELQKRGITRR